MLRPIGLALRARPLRQRRLRDFFLMSRPPLLCQEGCGTPNSFTLSLKPPTDITWTGSFSSFKGGDCSEDMKHLFLLATLLLTSVFLAGPLAPTIRTSRDRPSFLFEK